MLRYAACRGGVHASLGVFSTAAQFGIGLPKWLLDEKNKTSVLMMYLMGLVILVPAVVICWYRNSRKYASGEVMQKTIELFMRSLPGNLQPKCVHLQRYVPSALRPATACAAWLSRAADTLPRCATHCSEIPSLVAQSEEYVEKLKPSSRFMVRCRASLLPSRTAPCTSWCGLGLTPTLGGCRAKWRACRRLWTPTGRARTSRCVCGQRWMLGGMWALTVCAPPLTADP